MLRKHVYLIVFLFFTLHSNSQFVLENDSIGYCKSYYVPALNGTKLAVDVYFPIGKMNTTFPALLEFTRYWRSAEDPETGQPLPSLRRRDSLFLKNDYVLVKIDVRGTGASYGRRPGEYSPTEVKDAKFIVDWIVDQPWSDGTIGAYGTSYSGTTAELLCTTQHDAIQAVVLGWSDFDIYESPGRPYGMVASSFVKEWSQVVNWLDNNRSDILNMSIRRVGDSVPQEAIHDHRDNPDVFEGAKEAKYKDSRKMGDFTNFECSPVYWKDEISASNVPMLVLASWFDAGTADGVLQRFSDFSNPQKIVLMPTSHGGGSHASPYVVSNEVIAPQPSIEEQLELQLLFFNYHLKGFDLNVNEWPTIKYYNLGEEEFKTSEEWPPKQQKRVRYYTKKGNELDTVAPKKRKGCDRYEVNYEATTGTNNRWTTQMGKPILNLNDRNAQDSILLTYTSAPLEEDVQITGTPYVSLKLASSMDTGAVIVYLEDVDEHGNSTYITEGGLLFEHRKLAEDDASNPLPIHTFNEEDAEAMPINEVEEIKFKLWPTSVLIKKGHSIRIAISGADIDTFDRVPAKGVPEYRIYRNREHFSFIDLPIIDSKD